jgi:hypothetical protein
MERSNAKTHERHQTSRCDAPRLNEMSPSVGEGTQGPRLDLPQGGLIFGWHDYRSHIKAAAKQVLKGEAAKRFAGSHLRSAMTTHELEQGKNIIGIQYRVGHKLLSTTSLYVKPSFRAALETVASVPAQAPENQNLGVPQKKASKRKTA